MSWADVPDYAKKFLWVIAVIFIAGVMFRDFIGLPDRVMTVEERVAVVSSEQRRQNRKLDDLICMMVAKEHNNDPMQCLQR